MAVFESVSVCRLGGFEGSNPEFVEAFPSVVSADNELVNKSMPIGTEPGTFILDKLHGMNVFSYVFTAKSEETGIRDDLASISVVVSDKKVNIDQVEILFREIVTSLDKSGQLANSKVSTITQMLERIYNSVNKNQKLKIDAVTIDIPLIIKQKKLNILKKDLKEFQGAF
jgi:hypothetical protein